MLFVVTAPLPRERLECLCKDFATYVVWKSGHMYEREDVPKECYILDATLSTVRHALAYVLSMAKYEMKAKWVVVVGEEEDRQYAAEYGLTFIRADDLRLPC